jgi:hypothetical protein
MREVIMGDKSTKPSVVSDEDMDKAQGAGSIIQRIESPDVESFHGSDFNVSDSEGIAAMGNSGHFHGSDFNASRKK